MSDLPTWARAVLYAAGAVATAIILYLIVYYAVRAALRKHAAEQNSAVRRQEDLLRSISTSAEYVADVADAWAEAEAERRGTGSSAPAESPAPPAEPDAASSDRSE